MIDPRLMHDLDFLPEPFDDSFELELPADDRLELARSVVVALVRSGRVTDANQLTNTAFHLQHPDRDLDKKIDPVTEAGLAREWSALKASVVLPALQAGASPTSGTATVAAGTKVLLVGDSHTHAGFGKQLAQLLESTGARVVRQAKIGSAVKYWLPRLPGLLREHAPGLVIVALGANMRGYPSATGTSAQIRKLVALVRAERPSARLLWIGPPREKKDTEQTLQRFNTIIRAGLDQGTLFIDSAPHTPTYQGSDGVHYTDGAAKQWARGVFTQMGPR